MGQSLMPPSPALMAWKIAILARAFDGLASMVVPFT
jgi:hypothetical protein